MAKEASDRIQKYIEFEKSDRGREGLKATKKKNKKGTSVCFKNTLLLQEAVDSFNDREVLKLLKSGCPSNFVTGNGTSLLHRCAAGDNVLAAEMLLAHGADMNICDDDWWTPLHTACSCDSIDVLQLLLNNGADVTAMDVDGYFPVDQASDGSEAKSIITRYMDKLGITDHVLHQRRQARQGTLLDHIKSLPLAANVNQQNKDGNTLLHIAAANGYPSCLKALFKYNADINCLNKYGWSPLHVAARFNQQKSVELLLKKKANANLKDALGCKPSAYTSSDQIRGLLIKHERKQEREPPEIPYYLDLSAVEPELPEDGNVYHEIEEVPSPDGKPDGQVVGIFRINSKNMRAKNLSISKEDELLEAKQMFEAVTDPSLEDWPLPPPPLTPEEIEDVEDVEEDDGNTGDYISAAIWKSGGQEQGILMPAMENDNLVAMGTVQENEILKDLQTRYSKGQIYTLIGDILIAVNPFKELPIYAKDISMKYHIQRSDNTLPPHIYRIAENSFCRLLSDRKSQCHVISGESGSGKTETCKYLIQHLLRVAGSEETNLNSKINQVNPLLEAFGNAVTVMNNNSSRFGKFLELGLTLDGKVTGARISQYLLEKSRVVHQSSGELNFHIFYWMMAGLSPEEAQLYQLQNMQTFRYVRPMTTEMEKVSSSRDNKAKFWEVKDCLKDIGFSQADIQNVLMILSTVLHLGEINFHGIGNNEAAQVKNTNMLKTVSELLDVCEEELGSALVADYTVTRGEQIKKERTVSQAEACRDALAKSLYGRLFSWIVNGINQLIQPPEDQGFYSFQKSPAEDTSKPIPMRDDLQIGILDIFGFEDFQQNSFEQICINVANEQIQLFTNDHIFFQQQEDCLLEGVPLVDMNFSSNQPILDLFLERHTGVFSILDEESNFPKATDKSLATKLHQNTGRTHGQNYKTPKDGGLTFTVVHYAGSVTYDVRGILEKNRDTLPNSVLYTMKSSNHLLLKELFHSRVTRTGSLAPSARQQRSRRTTVKKVSSPFDFFKKLKGNKETKKQMKQVTVEKKGPSTMTYHFRNSLNDLVSKLSSSNPHFVRCIKPNNIKAAMKFDVENVLAQLRYTGISDIVKIRKYGYSYRLTYHAFLNKYQVLVSCCLPQFCPMPDQKKCEHILKHHSIKDVKFGKTKIFLKADQASALENCSIQEEQKVTKAQAVVRGFLGRQKSKKIKAGENKKDKAEYEMTLKKAEIARITESMSVLDDVIDGYETGFGKLKKTVTDDDNDDLYDDAFSVQVNRETDNVPVTDFNPESMNGHMHRGLPPTPNHGIDHSRPPPCPREMYSQGMYACIEDQGDYRRQAPPPPKRNPETRLSTASVSSTSSATYDELEVESGAHHHHHHQHQYQQQQHQQYHPQYHQQNIPARHPAQSSPNMRSKFNHEPQSPSHTSANRPFSYGAPMSPKLNRTPQANGAAHMPNHNQNGGQAIPPNPQVLYNYQYEDTTHVGSPAAAYGKHENAFHPQPHRPPPHCPPPPPPQGGYTQHDSQTAKLPPQSPRMQARHSVTTIPGNQQQRSPGSPRMAQKSIRSKSVPSHVEEESYLPAPPMANYTDYNRSASPPLPPPPPELLESPHNSRELPPLPSSPSHIPQSHFTRNTGLPVTAAPVPPVSIPSMYNQQPISSQAPPPPPPINTIPLKGNTPLPSNGGYQDNRRGSSTGPSTPVGYAPSPTNGGYQDNRRGNSTGPSTPVGYAPSPTPPSQSSREASPSAADLMNAIGKVQLKKTGEVNAAGTEAGETNVISGIKLRPTSARLKLLERDGLKPAPEEPPQPPREPSPPPPPPPAELQAPPPQPEPQHIQVSPAVNMFEKKVEDLTNNNKPFRGKGDTSKNSSMSVCIDDIDLSEVPGYTPITKATPIWKRDMIEKKNQEKLEEYIQMKEREKMEAEKWKNVPEWKRKLMMEKEREKSKMSEENQKKKSKAKDKPSEKELMADVKAAEEEAARKRRAKEAEEEKKAKEAEEEKKARLKEQQEMQKRMEEELESVPAWKREIMMKKGGAIKNWGDEREDINKQPGEEGYIPPEDEDENDAPPEVNEQDHKEQNNDPNRVFVQKAVLIMKPVGQNNTPNNKDTPSQKAPVKNTPVKGTTTPPKARLSLDENKLEEEWESLPLWKREILQKKGGAPSNWGDERAELNEEMIDH